MWHEYHELLPKSQKYSTGNRIDKLFIENIEAVATAAFLPREEKIPWVRLGMRKLDAIKILVMVLWETGSLIDKRYIALSVLLKDIGKDLGGWNGQLQKKTLPLK